MLIYLASWIFSWTLCFGIINAFIYRNSSKRWRDARMDGGIALLISNIAGAMLLIGIFVTLCLTGFVKYGLKFNFKEED